MSHRLSTSKIHLPLSTPLKIPPAHIYIARAGMWKYFGWVVNRFACTAPLDLLFHLQGAQRKEGAEWVMERRLRLTNPGVWASERERAGAPGPLNAAH